MCGPLSAMHMYATCVMMCGCSIGLDFNLKLTVCRHLFQPGTLICQVTTLINWVGFYM